MRVAKPVVSSVSTAIAQNVAGPFAGSNLPDGMRRTKRCSGSALFMPMTEIMVAGHADVGDERGAARQHAMIRGLHMRVRADHQARAPIAEMTHRLFLARRLAMDIDHDRVRRALERTGGKLALRCRERIVERIHEDAAHQVDDQHARAVLRIEQHHAAPRRAGRIIVRADEPRRARDEGERLALVPRMIAAGNNVRAGLDHLVVDRLGDAETAGRVLTVDDHAVELPVALEVGQTVVHGRTP